MKVWADKYGIYLWTPRVFASAMWPRRFWAVGRNTYMPHRGNYHFGPFYIAWYENLAPKEIG